MSDSKSSFALVIFNKHMFSDIFIFILDLKLLSKREPPL